MLEILYGEMYGEMYGASTAVRGVSMDQKVLKDTPQVLQLFFSSACRILLDLWTFSSRRARALSENLHVCARARARTPDYQYQKPDH